MTAKVCESVSVAESGCESGVKEPVSESFAKEKISESGMEDYASRGRRCRHPCGLYRSRV